MNLFLISLLCESRPSLSPLRPTLPKPSLPRPTLPIDRVYLNRVYLPAVCRRNDCRLVDLLPIYQVRVYRHKISKYACTIFSHENIEQAYSIMTPLERITLSVNCCNGERCMRTKYTPNATIFRLYCKLLYINRACVVFKCIDVHWSLIQFCSYNNACIFSGRFVHHAVFLIARVVIFSGGEHSDCQPKHHGHVCIFLHATDSYRRSGFQSHVT